MLVCVSLDHRSTSFDMLGELERHTAPLVEALADPSLVNGSVVLATCNRFEAYLDVPSNDRIDLALTRVSRVTGVDLHDIQKAAVIHQDIQAASHLFSVAGGLESVVVGEGEIAGQVRRALEQARTSGLTTTKLERVFQLAARTSREIKHRTGVQTAGRSLIRLALTMAHSRIGDWAASRTVLVGTGMYAGASLAALRARGAADIGVYSPSGRAADFAHSHGIRVITDSDLDASLSDADLVIATSLAREPLLTAEMFARTARAARRPYCLALRNEPKLREFSISRPRLVIDLGLPRNVAPDAESVSGVELLDLETIAKHAPIKELSAEAEARDIVDDAVREYAALQAEHDAIPALVSLRKHVYNIMNDELERLNVRAYASLPESEAIGQTAAIESALRHFTGRLLHAPSVRIRQMGRAGEASQAISAVESLFGVSDNSSH